MNEENILEIMSLKKSRESLNSSEVFPFHLGESESTAVSSKYTPMPVNFMNFPSIVNPLSPAVTIVQNPTIDLHIHHVSTYHTKKILNKLKINKLKIIYK